MTSPEELIEFAASLLETKSPSDVAIRTAVDRAYYGAYHACIEFEKALPLIGRLSQKPGGEHENLMQRLERPDPKLHATLLTLSKRLGASLRQLKQDRVRASYRIAIAISVSEAMVSLLQSKAILSDARNGQSITKALGLNAKQANL